MQWCRLCPSLHEGEHGPARSRLYLRGCIPVAGELPGAIVANCPSSISKVILRMLLQACQTSAILSQHGRIASCEILRLFQPVVPLGLKG